MFTVSCGCCDNALQVDYLHFMLVLFTITILGGLRFMISFTIWLHLQRFTSISVRSSIIIICHRVALYSWTVIILTELRLGRSRSEKSALPKPSLDRMMSSIKSERQANVRSFYFPAVMLSWSWFRAEQLFVE